MNAGPPRPSGARRRLALRLVGLAVAAALITFVVRQVPWQDALHLRVEGEDRLEVYPGEILGSWRDEELRFAFDPGLEAGPIAASNGLTDLVTGGGEVLVDNAQNALVDLDSAARVECRPGMPRAFRDLDLDLVPIALAALICASLFIVTRWWKLLLIAGCPTSWVGAFRLTYVGLFFNTILPGSTGGDLVRAYLVVRGHSERRADALTSVLADRVIGLTAMALLASTAIWSADARFAGLRPWVLFGLVSLVLGALAAINPGLRRLVRFDALLARLPQGRRLAKVDEAVRAYAQQPGALAVALLLSFGNHLCSVGCCYFIGHAFGDTHSFHDYVCIVTVANVASALPLSPGGLGVGEVAFGTLLLMADGLYMIGVATSIVYRLSQAALGLGGGLVLLLPGGAQVRSGYAEFKAADAPPEPPET